MIHAGDKVTLLPEYMDVGDEHYEWVACDDEKHGRVIISPTNHPMSIKPRYVVQTNWLGETA